MFYAQASRDQHVVSLDNNAQGGCKVEVGPVLEQFLGIHALLDSYKYSDQPVGNLNWEWFEQPCTVLSFLSDARFELKHVIITTSTSLNAFLHVTGK